MVPREVYTSPQLAQGVYMCSVVREKLEKGHWPARHRSGTCCGGTRVALLKRNGRMSDWAPGSGMLLNVVPVWLAASCQGKLPSRLWQLRSALTFLTCLPAAREAAEKFWCGWTRFSIGFRFSGECLTISSFKMEVIGRWPLAFPVNTNLLITCRENYSVRQM